jgi:serine/threonine protein kinase
MVDVLGKKLGRYEIRERLGRGGMASVYKGYDTNLDRWVAVKVLHEHLVEETGFKERFEREAKVVARLNHPNIVQVYDFDSADFDGQPVYYMVQAYIPGKSLKRVMDETQARGERLPMDQVNEVMRGVCSALSYAHAQGVVHRDVTPGNILFNERGHAVLSDFGLVLIVSATRLTQTGMTTGTPVYMPPEQGVGKAGDKRSDIYSMGVILYEMLTGQAPYSGDSAIAVIMAHINEPVPRLRDKNADLSPQMEVVVLRAMAKDPEDRYQDANDLDADFERALTGQEIVSKPIPQTLVLPVASAQAKRLPWAVIAGALALIVVVLVVAVVSRGPGHVTTAAGGDVDATVTLASAPTSAAKHNAPAMTSGPLPFKDEFGPDRQGLIWETTLDDPSIYRNIENGAYHIRTTLPATAITSKFDEEHQYGSLFQYDADFTISDKSQLDTGTGIVFRYQDDDTYYVFAINGLGQISIWLRSNGTWTELRKRDVNWTPFDGAHPAGQSNHLKLLDLGNRLQGYVNGKLAVDIQSEPVVMSGAIGIYVATTASRKVPNPMADVQVRSFAADYYKQVPATAAATQQSTPAATP